MKLSSKNLNWLILGAGLLVLLILLYFLLNDRLLVTPPEIERPLPELHEDEPELQTIDISQFITDGQVSLDDRGRLEAQLEKTATSFVERWVSASSQDNFSNISILKHQMTQSMIDWVDQYIEEQTADKNPDLYIGVQGQVVVANGTLASLSATSLEIEVKVRGQEYIASTSATPRIFLQDYQVNLVKEDGAWLVDKITWQDRQYQ